MQGLFDPCIYCESIPIHEGEKMFREEIARMEDLEKRIVALRGSL